MDSAVRFDGITKRFPGVQALRDVSLAIPPGTCHALCGENGAGKSTLGKVLAGIIAPDEGQLFVHERAVRFGTPRDALAAGVGMVHQELAFCDNLSVAENLCLADLPRARGLVQRPQMEERARAMLDAVGATIDVRRAIGELSIAQRQLVQIATAVGSGARILVFDEPTSSLGDQEAQRLYGLIDRLKSDGVTCIYVTHRMPEIFRVCDAVSVLRDGAHVATRPVSDVTEDELVRLMIGRPLDEFLPKHRSEVRATTTLSVESLTVPGKVADISFELRGGEILGLAGLVGAGRSELAETLFGITRHSSGTIRLNGKPVRVDSPATAIAHGIGLVPEDRKRQGLVLGETTLHNASLPILRRLSRRTWIDRDRERQVVGEYITRLRVRAPSMDTRVAALSGGNQQKVVLARWVAAGSSVLILDEPTRGVDVGAKAEIHALVVQLAASGTAVLLISSELPELIGLSDRILVLREGRIVGTVAGRGITEEPLLRMMAGIAQAT